MNASPIEIRARREADLPQLEELAAAVRVTDDYPADDPDYYLSPHVLTAWVAVDDSGALVGHAALHGTGAVETMTMAAEATGCSVEKLAAVSRMLVRSDARRRGVGRRLLAAVVDDAYARGLWPVLDTGAVFDAAIAMYESFGFTRVGPVSFPYRHGDQILMTTSVVYVGPPPPT